MILFFFIVNTSEFAYFFFKSGESHKGRQRLLVPPLTGWLSHWAVYLKPCWWALAVQLPLYLFCILHVSYSVMFVYTFDNVLLLQWFPNLFEPLPKSRQRLCLITHHISQRSLII